MDWALSTVPVALMVLWRSSAARVTVSVRARVASASFFPAPLKKDRIARRAIAPSTKGHFFLRRLTGTAAPPSDGGSFLNSCVKRMVDALLSGWMGRKYTKSFACEICPYYSRREEKCVALFLRGYEHSVNDRPFSPV